MSRGNVLSRLAAAVSAAYPNDSTRPGVHVSNLGSAQHYGKDRTWYCSIKRYQTSPHSQDIIAQGYGGTLDTAVVAAREEWVSKFIPILKVLDDVRKGR